VLDKKQVSSSSAQRPVVQIEPTSVVFSTPRRQAFRHPALQQRLKVADKIDFSGYRLL